ncbi:LacI family DNA-binding transcriptional regulator [Tenggerimyces flavus]|uniref:LacI family DNA-binding transcriptional regulator n=1 Tax=Tenggerimyces flavus TaxID=1708749 RepID=A0ABV7Y3Q0_9ACTN|nr:LacI family DNA-binding transcriptional regulator [Tenggerimyces flavus]MBM7788598.1 LacI family transcriptional regulator [Tenggerimyces flavus]
MAAASRRPGRPTQMDVARLAGVSQATVSQVLNDKATMVPVETRQRILAAAEELGYVPDSTARALRVRSSQTVAFIIPDITNPFYPAVERGVQDVAERYGYDVIVYNADGDEAKERKAIRSVRSRGVDGVIASFFRMTTTDLRPLLEHGVPVVRLEPRARRVSDLPLDNVFTDNVAAARTAVDHLVDKGYRRIGMISGRSGPGPARLSGLRQSLAAHGMKAVESLIVEGDFTESGGYSAMRRLLRSRRPPDAVFAANDLMAMGALLALRDAGARVPDDVAVMGFDDIPAAKLVSPSLTTVNLFQDRLGRQAAELLFERLRGPAPSVGRSVEIPYELVVRETT